VRKPYRFTVVGCGAGGATFETNGTIVCEFPDAFESALMETFTQLTAGRAVYGVPGLGCHGPYDIRRVIIEQVPQ
jgi:hypothetical protein